MNYKVLMSYERSEIIGSEQYIKLIQALDSDAQFIKINDRITNKSTIIDISPTTERARSKYILRTSEDDHLTAARKKYNEFRVNRLNEIFGVDKWRIIDVIKDDKLAQQITFEFKELYPEQYNLLRSKYA